VLGVLQRLKPQQEIPFELIRYMIGSLNYGGRVTKVQDDKVLQELLSTFICEQAVSQHTYRLTGLDAKQDSGIYYVPGDGDA